ncbi:MAG: response regulator transcription factor [Anaerolineaceae bacterium]|nr:response regulator transcription factor [Anaerolineaceae bacterium]
MKSQRELLFVDDENALLDSLSAFLTRSGYHVRKAIDGIDALQKIAKQPPDLIIMDVLMPRMDGREALRRLRAENNWIPVILLTQIGSASERAMALFEGADDYLNKPFEPTELLARIQAVLRRARPGQPSLSSADQLIAGTLRINRTAHRAFLAEEELLLTPKAMALLHFLVTHPDELLTRDRLLDAVWGWSSPTGSRAVDTRIAELRKALNDDALIPRFIETVPGEGYRFIHEVHRL